MAPVVGEIVLVNAPDKNGATEHPAIITAVFEGNVINCRVFEDGHDIKWYTSVAKIYSGAQESDEGNTRITWRYPMDSPIFKKE